MIPLFATFMQTVFLLLLGFIAIFLILLVLVQRGRGGGLAGALGGMGGSSAFGAKAGDVFTKVTCVAAGIWIVLCILATTMTPTEKSLLDTQVSTSAASTTDGPALGAPADVTEEGAEEGTDEAESSSEAATESPSESSTESSATTTETE